MKEYLTMSDLEQMTLKEIYEEARKYTIPYYSQMNKKELSLAVLRAQDDKAGFVETAGVLDLVSQEGYGFLRPINYTTSQEDVYVASSQIRKFGMRNGDFVSGRARPPRDNEKFYGLFHVDTVNGKSPEEAKSRPHFPALTPIYPNQKINLETTNDILTTREIDLFAPIGFGQRGLIVAPPKAGKTEVIKAIANGITNNHPDVNLLVLLIDERPEEVTELERNIKGEVVSSTFDKQPVNHVRLSELVLDRALRLVEDGRDVVILLDSITRLARANNLVTPPSGKTLSGGLDPSSLFKPKKFFGAARNIEEGGSLTIIATALVDTGSRMDDVIYEEFKGTGNMELQLSRELAERRLFPAIDLKKSGTRRDELLLTKDEQDISWRVRHDMKGNAIEMSQQITKLLKKTKNNLEFINNLKNKYDNSITKS